MKYAIIILFFLFSCGHRTDVKITYHFYVSDEELRLMSGGFEAKGLAVSKEETVLNHKTTYCDIYLLPFEEYKTNACYQAVVYHEQRHCYEGIYHPVNEGVVMPECDWSNK